MRTWKVSGRARGAHHLEQMRTRKESEQPIGTHMLESTDGGASEDTERKLPTDGGHSRTRERRGREE